MFKDIIERAIFTFVMAKLAKIDELNNLMIDSSDGSTIIEQTKIEMKNREIVEKIFKERRVLRFLYTK